MAAVKGEQLVTEAVPIKQLDLATMTAADADFTADFTLQPLVGAASTFHTTQMFKACSYVSRGPAGDACVPEYIVFSSVQFCS